MHDFRCVMQLTESDVEWMIGDIESSENHDDKKLILTIVLRHVPRQLMASLDQAVDSDHRLTEMLRESTALPGAGGGITACVIGGAVPPSGSIGGS